MFRLHLEQYITIGQNLAKCEDLLSGRQTEKFRSSADAIVAVMGQLKAACEGLELLTSSATINATMQNGLNGYSEIELIVRMVKAEMATRLFLHVPQERAKFWESDPALPEHVRMAFPAGISELRSAGSAYACGLWNASVFHSMRSAEQGLIKLASELGITATAGDQWGNIIEKAEASLDKIRKAPKTAYQSEKTRAMSELLVDARLFKDAWRNHVSHSLFNYSESHALEIMKSVARFLVAVSSAARTID